MFHLLKIENIKHLDVDGTILWQQNDIYNIFHSNGQQYLLNVMFNTSSGITIPSNYYLGLDNRTTSSIGDTLASLSNEPTQNGYLRQAVSSLNGFSVALGTDNTNYQATSNIAVFNATGGQWGPVSNLFLATTLTNTGYLISTAVLTSPVTVSSGQQVSMRISVGLINC